VALWQSLVADLEKFHAETATVKHLLVAYQPQTAKRLDNLRAEAVYSALAAEVKRTGKVPGFIALLGHTDGRSHLKSPCRRRCTSPLAGALLGPSCTGSA